MQKKLNKNLIFPIIVVSIALSLFVAMMILVLNNYSFAIDEYNILIAEGRNDFLSGFFKVFTHIGSFYVMAGLALVAVLLLWFVKKDRRTSVFYAVCFALTGVLNLLFKIIIGRARPESLMIIAETGYSFPSGHSMLAMTFFALAIHYVCKTIKNKPLKIALAVIFSIIISLVGFSRIYLGVHYLSDVIAGFLLSFVIVVVSLLAYNSKIFKFLKDKNQ